MLITVKPRLERSRRQAGTTARLAVSRRAETESRWGSAMKQRMASPAVCSTSINTTNRKLGTLGQLVNLNVHFNTDLNILIYINKISTFPIILMVK